MPTVKRFCIDAILFELACAESFQYDTFEAPLSRPFFSEWLWEKKFKNLFKQIKNENKNKSKKDPLYFLYLTAFEKKILENCS